MGRSSTCKIKFTGKIAVESATLPFAISVKIKYQSVHGVTINIINPKVLDDRKEIVLLTPSSKGVHKKLIVRLVQQILNCEIRFISFNGMLRNNPYSMKIRRGQ